MIRILLYVLVLAALLFAGLWIAERPGHVVIPWEGMEYRLAVGTLIFGILALAVIINLGIWLLRVILRIPGGLGEWRHNSRTRRGHAALTHGMVAIAAGDGEDARRHARKAMGLLENQPLALMLSAESARLEGDEDDAATHYRAMLSTPETEFLGVRGLLMQALGRGDIEEALELTRRAAALRPRTPWVLRALLDLQVREGQWLEALGTLHVASRERTFPQDERDRRKALILLLQAGEKLAASDNSPTVLEGLQKAHSLAPDIPRITRLLAEQKTAGGKAKQAVRMLEKAWVSHPHRELVEAWYEANARMTGLFSSKEKGDSPEQRLKLAEQLKRLNSGHVESDFVLAQAALEAGAWDKAHAVLDRMVTEQAPTARLYRLMARLAREGDGNPDAARRWLEGALEIGNPVHVCSNCGAVNEVWDPVCSNCGGFDCLAPECTSPRPDRIWPGPIEFSPAVDAAFTESEGGESLTSPDKAEDDPESLPASETVAESGVVEAESEPVTGRDADRDSGEAAQMDSNPEEEKQASSASADKATGPAGAGDERKEPALDEKAGPSEAAAPASPAIIVPPLDPEQEKQDRMQKAFSTAEAAEKAARYGAVGFGEGSGDR